VREKSARQKTKTSHSRLFFFFAYEYKNITKLFFKKVLLHYYYTYEKENVPLLLRRRRRRRRQRLAKPVVFVGVCFPNVFVQRLGAVLREIRVVSLDDAEKFVEMEATKRTTQSEVKRGNKSGCFLFARGG